MDLTHYPISILNQPFFQSFLSNDIHTYILNYQIQQLNTAIEKTLPVQWRVPLSPHQLNYRTKLQEEKNIAETKKRSLLPSSKPLSEFHSLDQRRIKLLKWIVNYQISLYSLYFTPSGRNYNENLTEWLSTKKNLRKNEYNEMPIVEQRPITEEIKFNDYNLFLHVKKKYLKTDECKYDFVETTPEQKEAFIHESQRRFQSRNNINRNNTEKIPFSVTSSRNLLGIGQLSFLQSYPLSEQIQISSALYDLVNLYASPINQPMNDLRYTYMDMILMCMTYVLFKNDRAITLNGNEGEGGFMSATRKNLSQMKLSKFEDLRFSRKTKEGSPIPQYRGYPAQSYMPGMYLLGYMIQYYLYHLNTNYVPKIHDLQFDFESSKSHSNESIEMKSMTFMNLASQRNRNRRLPFQFSANLSQILILGVKPTIPEREGAGAGATDSRIFLYNLPNYIPFLLKILIKLCDILIEYQHKCYFVHRDLHALNIMVNFNILSNGTIDEDRFEVKLIDFTLSSIVIQNKRGELSILGYTNRRPIHNLDICNPYINQEWKLVDLRYFIITLIITNLYNLKRGTNYIKIEKVNIFLHIILEIFKINDNYFENYIHYLDNPSPTIQKCYNQFNIDYRNLLINKELQKYIFGTDYNEINDNYNPTILRETLIKYLTK